MQNYRIIHTGPTDAAGEREQWILVCDSRGRPERLLQRFETPNAHWSGAPYVRPGTIAVPAIEFYTAELPDDVRRKLYKAIEELNAQGS